MNNKLIEELNYKIDNQEKIIKELQEKIILLNKMNEDNYNKYCNELKKNNKAIEYILKDYDEDEDDIECISIHIPTLLEILGGLKGEDNE